MHERLENNMTAQLLSNPKPALSKLAQWYRYYAMFSRTFADQVLSEANLKKGATVLDPWLGAGTTIASAGSLGFKPVGVDINPVMTTISSGRFITKTQATDLIESIDAHTDNAKCDPCEPLLDWFHPKTSAHFRNWTKYARSIDPENNSSKTCFLLTSLFETAKQLASGSKSKNPTWIKRDHLGSKPYISKSQLMREYVAFASNKADLCSPSLYQPLIKLCPSSSMGFENNSIDFVLTSPPYCTRIDYAVATRIELATLGYGENDVSILRDKLMGTPTIRRETLQPQTVWGQICCTLLNKIKEHCSKASYSYYYKTYIQYFHDLSESLQEIDRCVRKGGGIVMVVQDSFYKELHIDLQNIIIEMADGLGWRLYRQVDFEVKHSMRAINTKSLRYKRNSYATESALWFYKLS